ncbi:MAG: DsbA family protein [Alphaproteobacteria bacterium]|nr:MAG: DsbA family protein [Alphaproteobacteria bacterium]
MSHSASSRSSSSRAIILLVLFAVLLGLAGREWALGASRNADRTGSAAQSSSESGTAIRDYLLAHPEVVIEAIQRWQKDQQESLQSDMERRILRVWPQIADDGFSPVAGPADAPVTIVEYYDYRCPYCRRAHHDTQVLLEHYGKKIRYVFKQFPVLDRPGEPPYSRIAARAAVAAYRQGRFFELHDALMTAPRGLDEGRILAMAGKLGLDVERLKRDMHDPAIEEGIQRTLNRAASLGISGTPTYLINARPFEGAVGLDALEAAIDDALKRPEEEKH